ncbi:NAD(P)-dependent oxidoreductase [Microbacterium testaceum]|uniref:NAD(P)-dependent oxidoreductase n=1 Tax=Microbacterium testaceum TaxID=2033 RepID=UPI0034480B53
MNGRTVGFIGLGIMGVPMATNLVRAGFDVVVWARTAGPVDELIAAGARSAPDAAGVFEAAETVVLMMRDEAGSDAVLSRGADGFGERVADHTVVQMGTFSPEYSVRLAAEVEASGGRYVEAPVSGSRIPAENATLVGLLAGPAEALGHVAPVVESMCAQTFRCGDIPAALTMKLVVNTFLITMVTGLAETFHVAECVGADTAVLRDVLAASPMASAVSRGKADKVVDQDFSPQAAIADVLKNAHLAEGVARAAGASHPLLIASRALYEEAVVAGNGQLDMIGVVTALSDHRAAPHRAPDGGAE